MSEHPIGAYDITLVGIRLRYANVGLPYMDAHGERRCDVHGLPRTDREIFELILGPEEAERISGLFR
jgi:hypothetical protein